MTSNSNNPLMTVGINLLPDNELTKTNVQNQLNKISKKVTFNIQNITAKITAEALRTLKKQIQDKLHIEVNVKIKGVDFLNKQQSAPLSGYEKSINTFLQRYKMLKIADENMIKMTQNVMKSAQFNSLSDQKQNQILNALTKAEKNHNEAIMTKTKSMNVLHSEALLINKAYDANIALINKQKTATEKMRQSSQTFVKSSAGSLQTGIERYGYGNATDANKLMTELNRGGIFKTVDEIPMKVEAYRKQIARILLDLRNSHRRNLTDLNRELTAEQIVTREIERRNGLVERARARQGSYYDDQIRLREEEGRAFSRNLREQMTTRESAINTAFNQASGNARFTNSTTSLQNRIDLMTSRTGISADNLTQINTLQGRLDALSDTFMRLGHATPEFRDQLAALGIEYRRINSDVTAANRSGYDFNTMLTQGIKKMIIWSIAATALYAPLRGAQYMIKTLIEVEDAVVSVARVIDDATFKMDKFGQSMLEIAKQTGSTFKETADVAIRFAQAGYNVAETLQLTKTALMAVQTAELDATKATESMIGIMSQWQMKANEMPLLLDKINKVADAYTVTSEDLVQGLLRSSSAAKNLGINLDQTIALLTVMRETSGRTGKEVGNALNSILSYVTRSKTIDVFGKAGINVFADEAQTKFRNFMDVFEDISKNWNKLSKEIQDGFVASADEAQLFNQDLADTVGLEKEWSDVQKRDVSNAAAGVYRRNYFLGLIENFGKTKKVLEDLNGAQGYTLGEMDKKLKTISSKWIQLIDLIKQKIVTLGNSGATGLIKNILDALYWSVENLGKVIVVVGGIILFFSAKALAGLILSLGGVARATWTAIVALVSFQTAGVATARVATIIQASLGIIGIALALISIGMIAYTTYQNRAKDATEQFNDVLKVQARSYKDLKQEQESQIKSANTTMAQQEGQAELARKLNEELERMSKVTKKTQTEKLQMANVVDRLNEIIPDLNLNYNRETDVLETQTLAIDKQIDSFKELIYVKAFATMAEGAAQRKIEAQMNLENERLVQTRLMAEKKNSTRAVGGQTKSPISVAVDYLTDDLVASNKAMQENQKIIDESDALMKKASDKAAEWTAKWKKTVKSTGDPGKGGPDDPAGYVAPINSEKYMYDEKDRVLKYQEHLADATNKLELQRAEQDKLVNQGLSEKIELLKQEKQLMIDKKQALNDMTWEEGQIAREKKATLSGKSYGLKFDPDGNINVESETKIIKNRVAQLDAKAVVIDGMKAGIDKDAVQKEYDILKLQLDNFIRFSNEYRKYRQDYNANLIELSKAQGDINKKDVEVQAVRDKIFIESLDLYGKSAKDLENQLKDLDNQILEVDSDDFSKKKELQSEMLIKSKQLVVSYADDIAKLSTRFAEGKEQQDEYDKKMQELLDGWNAARKGVVSFTKSIKVLNESQLKLIEDTEKDIQDMIKKGVELKKEALDKELKDFKTMIDEKIKKNEEQYASEDYKTELAKEFKERQLTQNKINDLQFDTSLAGSKKRTDLQKELATQDEAIAKTELDRRRELVKNSLSDSLSDKEDTTEKAKTLIDDEWNGEKISLEARNALVNKSFANIASKFPELFSKLNVGTSSFFDQFTKYQIMFNNQTVTMAQNFKDNVLPQLEKALQYAAQLSSVSSANKAFDPTFLGGVGSMYYNGIGLDKPSNTPTQSTATSMFQSGVTKAMISLGDPSGSASSSQLRKLMGFDSGGVLPSGSAGINLSGKPEYVLTPALTKSFLGIINKLPSISNIFDKIFQSIKTSVPDISSINNSPMSLSIVVNGNADSGTTSSIKQAGNDIIYNIKKELNKRGAYR